MALLWLVGKCQGGVEYMYSSPLLHQFVDTAISSILRFDSIESIIPVQYTQ